MAKIKRVPRKPYTGGRQVCHTDRQWMLRRLELIERAEGKCEECLRDTPLWAGNAHHKNGTRGLGGGKRDDRLENLVWLCAWCHGQVHAELDKPNVTIH